MEKGALTSYIDVTQVVLYVFWFFFAGLIYYLRQEDKREGYALDAGGFPPPPEPKTFILPGGRTVEAPSGIVPDDGGDRIKQARDYPGEPFDPTGDPMRDAVGPATYADRLDEPDLTWEGEPKIVPLRVATDFAVHEKDPDPRGMEVVGADGAVAGTVSDVWVDRAERLVRHLELKVQSSGKTALLPIAFADINGKRNQVLVNAILGSQFAGVPELKSPNQLTAREEDRISAYYGGGTLYAEPSRAEPLM